MTSTAAVCYDALRQQACGNTGSEKDKKSSFHMFVHSPYNRNDLQY